MKRKSNSRELNPKDRVAVGKARWFSYIPLQVLVGVGLAFMEGARKYRRHNYRKAGVQASIYVDAAVSGHLTPWMEGEDIDPDSGLSHIDKAIASLMILRDGMLTKNWIDDRPPRIVDRKLFSKANRAVTVLIKKYPKDSPPHTEKEVK